MLTRRHLILGGSAAILRGASLTPKERVDRALAGQELDRPPFSFWYHFLDEKEPGARHAELTLAFHRKFRTDLVKVMSDYPYPRPKGNWYELREEANPFPEQVQALVRIKEGLAGQAHFVETLFNPWNVAEKLSSPGEVLRLMKEKPQALLEALTVIARSEANHARRARAAGASGVFLAIANAQDGILTREQYRRFSEPFDKMVLEAMKNAPLNTLHLHGPKVWVDAFYKGWPAGVLHYSAHETKVAIAEVRKSFAGVIMGGFDHTRLLQLSPDELRSQMKEARAQAGAKFILAPGCSAPNESKDDELQRIVRVIV